MYYYGARYYDPRISIFVSVDPLAEQTMTPYQYVNNNPIMLVDPTGMSAEGPPEGEFPQGHQHTDEDGTKWKLNGDLWENLSGGTNELVGSTTLQEITIEHDNRNIGTKIIDGFVDDFRKEALAMVPGNSSGVDQSWFDAMSIGGSFGISLGIINFNATLSLAATGDDAALVYGFDYGVGEFTKPGFGGGVTLNAHNLFGGSTDILNELGGEDLTYSAGYVVKGSYGTSSRTIGNNTQAATRGAKTYGVGFGYGLGVSKSNTKSYKLSNLKNDIPNGMSRIQNTVLQAITPPKMF
ncbi:RHS repeat-associated core domain-containing protein [Paenimyroides aestuarii]|uniref:RHS repeat-associated core domain-containing protein n=1 Tax=Paenimyroides aestuarii TaxID=2968490 RepID=A0ABY5NT06_9FLAO|nr:RHS repeat-associated core domain-containing protein [Paenimyroides aestuarii]UUV21721.1 RHS repeat-associated core domain-containing protein [Paenimyroides aestuarii]